MGVSGNTGTPFFGGIEMYIKMINPYGNAVRIADSVSKKYELERLGYKEVADNICSNAPEVTKTERKKVSGKSKNKNKS